MTAIDAREAPPAAGTPRRGGTLTMVGGGDVDHLDPALAYHTVTRGIMRACTRQLVTYRATDDLTAAGVIIPDLATEAAGPVDQAGVEYRFTLKDGVGWDVPGGRPITARDVERGIKRLAHPMAPSPGLTYFLSTIAGLAEFRDALVGLERRADVIAEFIESTEIEGLWAENERTIWFTLNRPASDFLNILALPFATPAPYEYAAHPPGSPAIEHHLISNGPYRVVAYAPGRTIRAERNPAWDPVTDDARPAYVDTIVVHEGVAEDDSHEQVMSGQADLLWDTQPPTDRLPGLFAAGDDRLEVFLAGLLSPYIVINFLSPNEGAATSKLGVRRALQYAVDKVAISEIWGGPRLNTIAHQILPPLSSARARELRPYPTDGDTGDPDRARRLLAEAGYPDGLTLRLVYRNRDIHPDTARAVRAALGRAGIEVELVPAPIEEFFGGYLASTAAARAGRWDIALSGWEPDWHGHNARVYLVALFDSSSVSDNDDWGTNFGHYHSDQTNALFEAALTAPDVDEANRIFAEAEEQIMADSAVVPILFAHQYWLHSRRVQNWLPYPILNGDPTNLWLADGV